MPCLPTFTITYLEDSVEHMKTSREYGWIVDIMKKIWNDADHGQATNGFGQKI